MLTIKLPSTTSAQLWGARRVVGVDIDDALVRMAWRRRRTLWSHQAPPSLPDPASSCPTGSSTSHLNLKRKRAPQPHPPPAPPAEADHFPASCQHMFGPLPIPPTPSSTETGITLDAGVSENAFPHNVSFRRADWVNERIPEDEPGYDVILACALPTYFPACQAKKKKKTRLLNDGLPFFLADFRCRSGFI